MMKTVALIAAAGVVASAQAQISLDEIAVVDLDAVFNGTTGNGSNPSAVAWDGSSVYAAGFNNTGAAGTTGIVRVDNALSSPSAPVSFGQIATNGLRGYSGLDIKMGTLAAAFDNGAADPQGIAAYDAAAGTQDWALNFRGGSGVGFDPGFGGVDSGVGHATFGSGRRQLTDTGTGAVIYNSSNGAIINGATSGTFWRDMDFNDAGDIWLRESNNVISGARTGGNSFAARSLVVDEPDAAFVNGQNISFVNSSAFGDFVVYNDREFGSGGQSFSDVVKFIDTSGAPLAVTFDAAFSIDLGNGFYDFDWDADSQTLAILDFNNRNVHIFAVPAPASAALLGLGALAMGRRRR